MNKYKYECTNNTQNVWGQSKHKERRKVKQFNTFNLKQKMNKK